MESREEFLDLLFVLLPLASGVLFLAIVLVLYYIRQSKIIRSIRGKYLDDVEYERQRISMELHDIYGPYSMQIRGLAESLDESVTDVGGRINDAITKLSEELRLKNQELFPLHLLNGPFEESLKFLSDTLSTQECNVDVTYEIETELPRQKKIHIFRIIQELSLNALKHAQPSFIQIQGTDTGSKLEFEIYYPSSLSSAMRHDRKRMGQSIIKERLRRIDAKRSVRVEDNMVLEIISMAK